MTRWLSGGGMVLIAAGILLAQPIVAIAGIVMLVIAWTYVHQAIAAWISRVLERLRTGHIPLILFTFIGGGGLGFIGVWVAGNLAISLLGALVWVTGMTRLGLHSRLWAAGRSDHWPFVGGVLLVPAVLLLVRIGVTPFMAILAVGLLVLAVFLVILRGRAPVVVGTIFGLTAWMTFWIFAQPSDTSPADPHEDSARTLVAMGDSYMSGEGAFAYLPGTNTESVNECRRASSSYAYQVADRLNMSLNFLACSGARTSDVTQQEQFAGIGRQIDGLRQVKAQLGAGSVVLISIGGNDAGFGEIGKACLVPGSCAVWGEQWLRWIREQVQKDIVGVHRQIRNTVPEGVPVFAVTYPVVLKPESCLWSPLSNAEHSFLATQLIIDLNDSVKRAAETAGINVIDLEKVLEENSRRICDRADPQQSAVNIIGLSPVEGTFLDRVNPQTWFHGSLHPNPEGHAVFDDIIEAAVTAKLERIAAGEVANPEPLDEPSARRGTALPRFGEDRAAFTELPEPLVADHGGVCGAEYTPRISLAVFVDTSNTDETGQRRVFGVKSGSSACLRDGNGTWSEIEASELGTLDIPWAFPQTSEPIQAFYETETGDSAVIEVVFCLMTPTRCPASGTSQWVAEQLRLLLFGVGLPVWALALIGTNLVLGSIGSEAPGPTSERWRATVLRGPASAVAGGSVETFMKGFDPTKAADSDS